MKRTPTAKSKALSPIALAAAVAVASLAGACDEFSFVSLLSLPDQVVPEELVLTVAQDSVPSGSSVPLEVSGGTLPYTFTLAGSDLYQPTRDRSLGSIDNSKFTAGQAIGTVLITVEDASGGSAFIEVAVIPPTVTFTSNTKRNGSSNIQIEWTFPDASMISSFTIEESTSDGPFITLDPEPAATTVNLLYTDHQITTKYTYRVYAVALQGTQIYKSQAAEFTFY